jgi:hypothetical protein
LQAQPVKLAIRYRYPTKTVLITGETKLHIWEIWWFVDDTNEFNALVSRAEMAARYNPSPDARFFIGGELESTLRWQLGIVMRPLVGDKVIFEQMKREFVGMVASGVTNLAANKAANKILQGKPVGGGGNDPNVPGKKKVDLSKPGAFRQLANASPDEVAAALRDPVVFATYKKSLGKGPDADQARADIQELGKIIAQHTPKSGNTYKMNPAVSAAVWALPEHLRGVLIEQTLANTLYKGWFNAGQLNQGFFPDIDFAITTPGTGPQQRASVKSVNTRTKGYEKQLNETLPEHIETIVTSTKNDIKAGNRPAHTTVDIRVPPGSAVPISDLGKTLRDLVPKDVRKFIKIVISEF